LLALYIALVICTVAVLGTAAAIYVRVRRHRHDAEAKPPEESTAAMYFREELKPRE